MIDTYYRKPFQDYLITPVVNRIAPRRWSPLLFTLAGLGAGVLAAIAIGFGLPYLALALLLISGYCDVLDGSLARATNRVSEQGAVLDIVSDRIVESALILGLYFVDPTARALLCLSMLASVLICVTSFLVVGIFTANDSQKSFHYSPGLMERSEAFILFTLMIAAPHAFTPLASLFTGLVAATAAVRLWQFGRPSIPKEQC